MWLLYRLVKPGKVWANAAEAVYTSRDMLHNLLHLDAYIPQLIVKYGTTIYGILFAVVFCETGLIVLPFLPGDSLLFACGAVSAGGGLNLALLYPLFVVAALCGDNVNYWVGRGLGRKLFANENSPIFKRQHLTKTEAFFDKYGTKAIILARFVPIVRTFAPFVAGMGQMAYPRFLTFSVLGALLWVGIGVTAGRLLGQIPFFHDHFSAVVIAVVVLSLIPIIVEFLMHRRAAAAADTPQSSAGGR